MLRVSLGQFKICIIPKDTDVSVRYDIIVDEEKLNNTDIIIESIEETLGEIELIKTASNTYTGIIPLDQIKAGKQSEITVHIKWLDNEENNEADVELGLTYETTIVNIPITVHVSQYLGEEIESWKEDV